MLQARRLPACSRYICRLPVLSALGHGAEGLHNPHLLHGGFPIVDGLVTSFNTAAIVRFDALVVPWIGWGCRATHTCDLLRRAIVAAECAADRVKGAVGFGKSTSMCKQFDYVDGLSVNANLWWRLASPGDA